MPDIPQPIGAMSRVSAAGTSALTFSALAQRKLLELRRDDACASCATPLPAGTRAYWLTPERAVLCEACGAQPTPQPKERAAGASAQAEYERRRHARVSRAEDRFGTIGRWIAQLSAGPQHERAWRVGASGEAENAGRLEKRLEDTPVRLLHDCRVPGSAANIDHIAVGPCGVTVIDSKHLTGKVKVDWSGGLFSERKWDLYVGGCKRTNLVDKVEQQMHVVREILEAAGLGYVEVHGAMCMAETAGLPIFGHPSMRGIAIDGTRRVAKLVSRDGPLTLEAVEQIRGVLDRALPPA